MRLPEHRPDVEDGVGLGAGEWTQAATRPARAAVRAVMTTWAEGGLWLPVFCAVDQRSQGGHATLVQETTRQGIVDRRCQPRRQDPSAGRHQGGRNRHGRYAFHRCHLLGRQPPTLDQDGRWKGGSTAAGMDDPDLSRVDQGQVVDGQHGLIGDDCARADQGDSLGVFRHGSGGHLQHAVHAVTRPRQRSSTGQLAESHWRDAQRRGVCGRDDAMSVECTPAQHCPVSGVRTGHGGSVVTSCWFGHQVRLAFRFSPLPATAGSGPRAAAGVRAAIAEGNRGLECGKGIPGK
ncbi:hypothetical protein SAMN05660199_01167 [Klenkia soli]|uniref:Uncharacterized protein n=1 Tax=Klenkia soli TaxID=1052260 RepID=A0A1H0G863_9ACTN|nr:hypothetical protein SAMN05660199_01167 [Klenkia soli]